VQAGIDKQVTLLLFLMAPAVVAAFVLSLLSVPQELLLIESEELNNDELRSQNDAICSTGEAQTM
jgi:hypothetical protein